jgi:hypothetical protein
MNLDFMMPIEQVEAKIYIRHPEWRHEYVVVREDRKPGKTIINPGITELSDIDP